MSAFLSVDLLTDFAAILFNRFYRLAIHSLMVCNFDPACDCCPPWTKELYGTCVLLPLYERGGGGGELGGVEMYCGPYSVGVLHSVSDQIQNLQNSFTAPNKNDQ
jgi:hypothetical protein